jgi:hypothetical protein
LAIKGVALRNKGRHSVQVLETPLGDVFETLAVTRIGFDVYEFDRRQAHSGGRIGCNN